MIKRAFVIWIFALFTQSAFSQMTLIQSRYYGDLHAQGERGSFVGVSEMTARVGNMFGGASIDAPRALLSPTYYSFYGRSNVGKGFDPLPASSVLRIVIDFSIAKPSTADYYWHIRDLTLTGDGARNHFSATLKGPEGTLLSVYEENLESEVGSRIYVPSMTPGNYRLEVSSGSALSGTENSGLVTIMQSNRFLIYDAPVPEPASMAVLALGLAAFRRRRR